MIVVIQKLTKEKSYYYGDQRIEKNKYAFKNNFNQTLQDLFKELNTLINMGKTILDNIDPEWKIKLEGENVGMTDKLIKEFIKQNTGDSIYEN